MIIQKLNFRSITNDQVHPEKELSDLFNTQSKKMALCFLGQNDSEKSPFLSLYKYNMLTES